MAEPREGTLWLVRAVGARLRTPLSADRRDVLATQLAAAATEARDAQASSRWRRIVLRRPAALVGAVAALAVLVAGVGVVTRTGDDLPVLVLASGAPGGGAAGGVMAADAAPGPESLRSSPMPEPLIGIWQPTRYTFTLADGVTLDVDRGAAWRFVPPAADDLADAATRLADAFGLPAPTPAEGDPTSWSAQAEDGANLWVSASGDWFYGGPHDLWSVWDCPVLEPRPGEVVDDEDPAATSEPTFIKPEDCVAPELPDGVPSEARARELALALLERLGLDAGRVTDVYADEWSAWVTLELPLPDGSGLSGLSFGVGFAGDERVSSASGTLAELERFGDYPLLELSDALPRLEQEMNAWLDEDPEMRPMPLPAVEPGEGSVGILPLPESSEPSEPVEEPAPQPVPDLPAEMPEPVDRTVVIVGAELVTSMVWTADGTLVLVPHYRLTDADGAWWWVVAVADEYVQR